MAINAGVTYYTSGPCNQANTPGCITEKINEIKSQPVQNPPATVWEYTYKGGKVYYIVAPCCDQLNPLYNSNCNIICHPDGGIANQGDEKCVDFFNVRKAGPPEPEIESSHPFLMSCDSNTFCPQRL